MMNRLIILGIIVVQIGLTAALSWSDAPRSAASSEPKQSALEEVQWGGHLRALGSVTMLDDQARTLWGKNSNLIDGYGAFRLNNDLFFNSGWQFQAHYEAFTAIGDTVEATGILREQFPEIPAADLGSAMVIDDDRRLMDLTRIIEDDRRHLIYHRLDRLNLALTRPWGMIRLGRQALTWGNGLVFHPMDLFNPFSPTAITKDYKTGDDMAMAQVPVESTGDLQILYVPRRHPVNRDLKWDQSSLAGKYHQSTERIEMDVMAAYHFEDIVIGIGATGTVRDAAWRLDMTWTFPDEHSDTGSYLSAVANIDYAWTWWEKNVYGLIEFYFNGLGENNNPAVSQNTALVTRLERADLFVTGRAYLAGEIQIEAHPLVRIDLGAIYNLGDLSGLLQPRLVWDVVTNWQLITGIRWYFGGRTTEFGGDDVQMTDHTISFSPPDTAYLQVTRFF